MPWPPKSGIWATVPAVNSKAATSPTQRPRAKMTPPKMPGTAEGLSLIHIYPRDEFHHAEGLCQIVIGAGVESHHFVELGAFGREHHDEMCIRDSTQGGADAQGATGGSQSASPSSGAGSGTSDASSGNTGAGTSRDAQGGAAGGTNR